MHQQRIRHVKSITYPKLLATRGKLTKLLNLSSLIVNWRKI